MGTVVSWYQFSSRTLRSLIVTLVLARVAWSQSDTQTLCGDTQSWNSTTLPYSCELDTTLVNCECGDPVYLARSWEEPLLITFVTVSNNAWGDDGSGSSCLQVNDGGSSFQVTYKWTNNYYNVHGYPYMKLEDSGIPINISEIASLNFSGQWITYVDGTQNDTEADQAQALDRARVRSNVAIDMFLDTSPDLAQQFRPTYEIMIWFWSVAGIDPVGTPAKDGNGNQMQYDIAGIRYYLYYGTNDHGQHVYSWLSNNQINNTSADYYPLLQYLWQFNQISPDLYLGSIDFGTETFYAASTTIFSASQYNLSISTLSNSNDTAPLPPLQTPSPIPKSQASIRGEISWTVMLALCMSVLLVLELG